MELRKLMTLTFARNVGTGDRVFRVLSGAALTGTGWYFGLPLRVSIVMSTLGVMWTATGVLSKCSIYYLLGHSTRPIKSTTDVG